MVTNGSEIHCTPSFAPIVYPKSSGNYSSFSGFATVGGLICGSGSELRTELIARYHISDKWLRTLKDNGEYIKLEDQTGLQNRDISVPKSVNGNTTNYCVRSYQYF